jgi:hypothetical protein
MEIEYSCKFNGDRQYEMHEMVFHLTDEEVFESECDIPLVKKLAYLQRELLWQGLLFQNSLGYLTNGEVKEKKTKLEASALSLLADGGNGGQDSNGNKGADQGVEGGAE